MKKKKSMTNCILMNLLTAKIHKISREMVQKSLNKRQRSKKLVSLNQKWSRLSNNQKRN